MRGKTRILVAAIVAAAVWQCTAERIAGKVTRVSDGDTIWVTDAARQRHKVRLNRIDAPEKDQPWGEESAVALTRLILDKDVQIEYEKHDRYGRMLGIVYDGTNDINLVMVRSGNAWHYKHFDKTPAYSAAERDARNARRGLWSQFNPVRPSDWRASKRKM